MSKIKQLRYENNLSQAELAKELGVSRTCVSAWEIGARTPSFKNIISLCKIFDKTPSYFYDADQDDHTPNLLFDASILNAKGIKKLSDLYEKLVKDEKYLKKP